MSGDAHADRTAKFQHAIKHLDCDFHLTQTTCVSATEGYSNRSGAFSRHQFSADCTITIFGFDFRQGQVPAREHALLLEEERRRMVARFAGPG